MSLRDNKRINLTPMERFMSKKAQKDFKDETGVKFLYCRDDKFYCPSISTDPKLLETFIRYFEKYRSKQPWSKILKSDFLENIPTTIRKQKVYCDGTFLREENAMKRSAEGRTDFLGNQYEFYQCELLILYLSTVERMTRLHHANELAVVGKFFETNRRSFRGELRSLYQAVGEERRRQTYRQYELYFKPIFQKIRGFIKKKGSGKAMF